MRLFVGTGLVALVVACTALATAWPCEAASSEPLGAAPAAVGPWDDPSLLAMERDSSPDPAVAWAMRLLLEHRFVDAVEAVRSLLMPASMAGPDDRAHAFMLAGIGLAAGGDPGQGLRLLREALALRPQSVIARLNVARLALALGQVAEAQAVLEEALRSQASPDRRVLEWSASLALNEGRPETALRLLEQALMAGPLSGAWSYYNLGLAYQSGGQREKAQDAYRQALALDDGHAPSLNNLGALALARGDREAAEAYLRRATQSDPSEALYHGNLGMLLRASGQVSGAVEHLERAAEIAPAPRWLVELGNTLLAASQWDRAEEVLVRALGQDPENGTALLGLGLSLLGRGEPVRALPYLEKAVQLLPASWRAWHALALARAGAGDRSAALEPAQEAVKLAPALAEPRMALAEISMQAGDRARAKEQYTAALALAGSRPDILYGLGRVELLDGNAAAAARSFERAATLESAPPVRALYWYARAVALESAGDAHGAVEALRASVEADGTMFDAQLRLGELLLARGEFGAAREALERAVALRPGDRRAREALDAARAGTS